MKKTITPFRLALREEGEDWVAYLAPMTTMEGARRLFSMPMIFVRSNPARKEEFMTFARNVVGDIVRESGAGVITDWLPPKRAPENERSGRA